MSNCSWLLLLLGVASILEQCAVAKKYNVTVGYLPCVTGDSRNMQGRSISGAVSMALEEINNSTDLLPDVDLLLEWNDTKCDTVIATRLVTDMSCSGVVAFFGPEGRCQTEAIIAQSRNLPMISYKCSDYSSTLPNFLSLNPSERQATKSVLSLLRYYGWNKFSIIYEEQWAQAALTLEAHANNKNMTVNHRRLYLDEYTCCLEKMLCCESSFWTKLIQETKERTRIYVVMGSTSNLIDMMTAMETQYLFDNGEYMVVFVDMMPYTPSDSMKYLIKPEDRGRKSSVCPNSVRFYKRARSLLVAVSTALDLESSYKDFTSRVIQFTAQEPFKFHRPSILDMKFLKFVSIYAAYLYDSVKLYATALHSLLEEDTTQRNLSLTYERLMAVATNGSRIVARMITNAPFKSVSGKLIRFDEEGESEGNFSVLAFKQLVNLINTGIICNHTMIPVGHFLHSVTEFPEYKINPRLPIDWPDSVKPEDEPSCGFLNEKCPKDDSQITSLMTIGLIAFTLLCIVLCLFFIVRKVKTSRLRKRLIINY